MYFDIPTECDVYRRGNYILVGSEEGYPNIVDVRTVHAQGMSGFLLPDFYRGEEVDFLRSI
jgi:hypothetical protein